MLLVAPPNMSVRMLCFIPHPHPHPLAFNPRPPSFVHHSPNPPLSLFPRHSTTPVPISPYLVFRWSSSFSPPPFLAQKPPRLITTFEIIRPRTKPRLPSARTAVVGEIAIPCSFSAAERVKAGTIAIVGAAGAEAGGDGSAVVGAGLGVAAALGAGGVGGGGGGESEEEGGGYEGEEVHFGFWEGGGVVLLWRRGLLF